MEAWILALLAYLAPPDRAAVLPAQADNLATALAFGPLPFRGPAAAKATAIALAVIAHQEGMGFDPRVESCVVTGDQGRTVSLYGLMRGASWRGHAREDLCRGGPLPAYLALLVLAGYAERCPSSGPAGWFRGYSTGSCAVLSDAAAVMCARWERLARQHGLVGASCVTRAQPITFAP